ncbi:MAG: helix-turn-helix domain-containing protein [Pseudomonadota bacterium]
MRDYTADELGRKLFESVRQMQSGQIGRSTLVTPNQVAEARLRTGLSQTQFAQALNISARTLQEWEQGRRQPSGAAQALINIAFKHPQVIVDELGQC